MGNQCVYMRQSCNKLSNGIGFKCTSSSSVLYSCCDESANITSTVFQQLVVLKSNVNDQFDLKVKIIIL